MGNIKEPFKTVILFILFFLGFFVLFFGGTYLDSGVWPVDHIRAILIISIIESCLCISLYKTAGDGAGLG